jgi:hypothetical protein
MALLNGGKEVLKTQDVDECDKFLIKRWLAFVSPPATCLAACLPYFDIAHQTTAILWVTGDAPSRGLWERKRNTEILASPE